MTKVDALTGPMRAPTSGKPATSAVVLLHGYGSNGDDLIGLVPFFAQALPDTVFYSPNGAEPLDVGFGAGYQWFGLTNYDPAAMARDPAALTARFENYGPGADKVTPVINKFLDQVLEEHSLEANRLALIGFSQGTMMSLHVGLRREKQLAGILGFSGALLGGSKLGTALKSKPPVLLIHGDSDPVVPPQASVEAAKILKANGVSCETGFVQGLQHSIDGSGAQAGAAFLKKQLS